MSLDILVNERELESARARLDPTLSPRSPGFGAHSAPVTPPPDPVELMRRTPRRPRQEAALGRPTRGTRGDVDVNGVGVSEAEAALPERVAEARLRTLDDALAFRQKVVDAVEKAKEVTGEAPLQAQPMIVMADRVVRRAKIAAGVAEAEDLEEEQWDEEGWPADADLREQLMETGWLNEDGEERGAAFREFFGGEDALTEAAANVLADSSARDQTTWDHILENDRRS
jgi:hypothetical protein